MLLAFRKLLEIDDRLKLIFVGPDFGLSVAGRAPIFFDEFTNSLFKGETRGRIDYMGQLPRDQIVGHEK